MLMHSGIYCALLPVRFLVLVHVVNEVTGVNYTACFDEADRNELGTLCVVSNSIALSYLFTCHA